ncbi:MAG: CvpA family protein [Paludibacteraceae bacterium]|nr:CvpA family protein [Paludibacteraceae bacterium]
MSWLDIIILFPLLIGLVRGLMRGLVIEVASIAAIVMGYICSRWCGPSFASWLLYAFSWDEATCVVVASAIIFVVVALLLQSLAKLLTNTLKKTAIGWMNRALGGMFGVLKWGVIIFVLVLYTHRLDDQFHFMTEELKESSVVYKKAAPLSEEIWEEVSKQVDAKQLERLKEVVI